MWYITLKKGVDGIDKTLINIGNKKITDSMAIIALAVSLYLPFVCTIAVAVALFVAVVANPRTRKTVFYGRGILLLGSFFALSLAASIIGRNWLGASLTVFILATVALGVYIMSVMNRELFLRLIKVIFRMVPIVTAAALIEFAVRYYFVEIREQKIRFMLRCVGFFMNPNYFGTVAAMTALLCIYYFIINRSERKKSVAVGICAVVCLVLSQSMFSCVELLAGALVMLIISHRWKYLAILTVCLTLGAVAVAAFPQLVPRLAESGETFGLRLRIWRVSAEMFKASPIIGQGPHTYFHAYSEYIDKIPGVKVWPTQHAHNILLDSLISYGIIGASLMWSSVVIFAARVIAALRQKGDIFVTALVAAVCAGVLVHGMVDITVLWIQPALLFFIMLSSANDKSSSV